MNLLLFPFPGLSPVGYKELCGTDPIRYDSRDML